MTLFRQTEDTVKRLCNLASTTVLAAAILLLAVACGSGSAPEQSPGASAPPTGSPTSSPTTGAGGAAAHGELRPIATEDSAPDAPEPTPDPTEAPAASEIDQGGPGQGTDADPAFVDSWRAYSEYIYYDAGGSGGSDASASGTTRLDLYADGSWQFGSSSGYWSIEPIAPSDWDRWGVSGYGPERKVVLQGWNGGAEGGPIEESAGYVDFVWVIYHVESPDPGLIYIKFGH